MAKTFKGGIHVPSSKNTKDSPIVDFPPPKIVSIPLSQHIGAPAAPLVSKGDAVSVGQIIGYTPSGLSCPVHASVSGVVKDVEMRPSYTGYGKTAHVIIENDFQNTLHESVKPRYESLDEADSDGICEIVKQAGIAGMGGAAFPTYAKIQSAIGKATDLIVNCAECEPYITANHRLMLEEPERIIGGTKILLKALGLNHAIFAVEDNKKDAAAVYTAFTTGMPLVSRVVTVDGDAVCEPKNIRVPIGTSYEDVFAFCGGLKESAARIISGGPMMGNAQWDYNAVIMKNTSALLVLSDENISVKAENAACIHCGKCVSVCPMHLMPNYLAAFSKADNDEMCEKFSLLSCVECGCCTYTCPARVPIVQLIRNKKAKILAARKKAAAAAADKM